MRFLPTLLVLLFPLLSFSQNWQLIGYPPEQVNAVNKVGDMIEYGVRNQHFVSTDGGTSWEAQLSSANMPHFSSFNNMMPGQVNQFSGINNYLFEEADFYYSSISAYYVASTMYWSAATSDSLLARGSGFVGQKSSLRLTNIKKLTPNIFVANDQGSIDYFGSFYQTRISTDSGNSWVSLNDYNIPTERYMETIDLRGNIALLHNSKYIYHKSIPAAVKLDSFPLPTPVASTNYKWYFAKDGQDVLGILLEFGTGIISRYTSSDLGANWMLNESHDWTLGQHILGLFSHNYLFAKNGNSDALYRVPIKNLAALNTLQPISFNNLNTPPNLNFARLTQPENNEIFITESTGKLDPIIYFSEDDGATWQELPGVLYSTENMLQLGNAWYTVHFNRIYRTEDGRKFTNVSPDPDRTYSGLEIVNGQLVVQHLGYPSMIFTSPDGNNWTPVPTPPITVDYMVHSNGLMYAAEGNDAYRSTNFGVTWIPYNGKLPIFGTKYDPATGQWYYLAADAQNENYIYYHSSDQGATWQSSTVNNPAAWIIPFVYAYDFLMYDNNFIFRAQNKIYLSEDAGQQWTMLDNLPFAEGGARIKVKGSELQIRSANEGIWAAALSDIITTTPRFTDLELTSSTPNADPDQWRATEINYTLSNKGNTEATDIVVLVDPLPSGFVYLGGQEFTASQGSFNPYFGANNWTVGTLAAGQTATLTIRLFNRDTQGKVVFAQVQAATGNDEDSTPSNGSCCIAQEDDETAVGFHGGIGTNCELTVNWAYPVCDNNNTPNDVSDDIFYFSIRPLGTNLGANGWTTSIRGATFTGDYNNNYQIGPFAIADGQVLFDVQDQDNPDCKYTLAVTPPNTCSGGGGGQQCTANLLVNGSFEEERVGWEQTSGIVTGINFSSDAYDGDKALQVTTNSNTTIVFEQNIAIANPTVEHALSFYGKRLTLNNNPNPGTAFVRLNAYDASNRFLSIVHVSNILAATYNEYASLVDLPAETAYVEIEIYASTSGDFGLVSVLLDQMCFQESGVVVTPCIMAVDITNVSCEPAANGYRKVTFDYAVSGTNLQPNAYWRSDMAFNLTQNGIPDIMQVRGDFPATGTGSNFIRDGETTLQQNFIARGELCGATKFIECGSGGDCENNLVANPGFEDGLNSWYGDALELTLEAANGQQAMKVCGTGYQRAYQSVRVEPGKTYTIKFMAKGEGFLEYKFLSSTWQPIPFNVRQSINTNTYEERTLNVPAPAGAVYFEISPTKYGSECLYVDDFCFEEEGVIGSPNLELVSVDCPANFPNPGQRILWNFEIKNNGTGPSQVRELYLYNGAFLLGTSPNVEYGFVTVPALEAGESARLSYVLDADVYLPSASGIGAGENSVFTGQRYLSWSADGSTNDFPNANELFDPYCKKTATDLELNLELITAPAVNTDAITFRMIITNNGPERAYNIRTTFDSGAIPLGFSLPTVTAVLSKGEYWSLNRGGAGSTPYDYSWYIPTLESGETVTAEVNIKPPTGLFWPQTIELQRTVESGHNEDINPANNEAELIINLSADQPDLQLANLATATSTVKQGEILDFTFDLSNTGTGNASGSYTIKSWLSLDQQLSADDIQNGLIPTGNLNAGSTIPQVVGALSVATNLALGDYYLILKVDADEEITESDETNNVLASTNQITVIPNAAPKPVLTSVTCPDNFPGPGVSLTWDFTMQNVGSVATIEQEVYMFNGIFFGPAYFSTLYGSTTIPAIAPGASVDLRIEVPASAYFPEPGQADRGEQFIFTGDIYLSLSDDGFMRDYDFEEDRFDPYCKTLATDLEIEMEQVTPSANLFPADSVTYRITIRNNGPEKAYNTTANLATGTQAGSVPDIRSILSKGEQWLQTPDLGGGGGQYYYYWYLPELEIDEVVTAEVTVYPHYTNQLNYPFTIYSEAFCGHNTDPEPVNNLASLQIIGTSDEPDLEIALEALPDDQPSQYTTFQVRLRVTNTGGEDANNVSIALPKPDGVVYSGGNEFTATQGSYNIYTDQAWDVGTVAAGESQYLDVNLFLLSAAVIDFYAEVSEQDGGDADSSPGNGNGSTATEDDEAAISINNTTANRNAARHQLVEQSLFEAEVKRLFPNPARNELNLGIESQREVEQFEIRIFDVSGQLVLTKQVQLSEGYNQLQMNINTLPAGVYTILPETPHRHKPLYFVKIKM